ncbi:MAG TPA: MEDS domain-containing protein, partial [Kofleriaceae bacterium]|nr:MEDS domain-containing protein [Kofleriaceae bacterium]
MGSERDLRRNGRGEGFEEVGTEFLTRLAEPGHVVQFYESDELLCALVADYLAAGIQAGEPLVVFATCEHRDVFRQMLGARGFDVDRMCAGGRLSLIDARETLDRFMVDDMPDRDRFESVIGGAIERGRLHARRARVRTYVEMVDLLWRDGNEQAALGLEEMWDELGKSRRLSLLCAYVMGSFYKEGHSDGPPATLHQICRTHTHLLPPEPTARSSGAARRAQLGMTARRARRLAAEIEHRKAIEKALRSSLSRLRGAEEALRESQEELQDFVDNAVEGMEWLDPQGVILWANRAQLDLLGYGRHEYIGHHVSEFRVDAVDDFA